MRDPPDEDIIDRVQKERLGRRIASAKVGSHDSANLDGEGTRARFGKHRPFAIQLSGADATLNQHYPALRDVGIGRGRNRDDTIRQRLHRRRDLRWQLQKIAMSN